VNIINLTKSSVLTEPEDLEQ